MIFCRSRFSFKTFLLKIISLHEKRKISFDYVLHQKGAGTPQREGSMYMERIRKLEKQVAQMMTRPLFGPVRDSGPYVVQNVFLLIILKRI